MDFKIAYTISFISFLKFLLWVYLAMKFSLEYEMVGKSLELPAQIAFSRFKAFISALACVVFVISCVLNLVYGFYLMTESED